MHGEDWASQVTLGTKFSHIDLTKNCDVPHSCHSPTKRPLAGLVGLDESAADGEGEAEDGTDEVQKIWRDMKVRKYGSGGGGSIGG